MGSSKSTPYSGHIFISYSSDDQVRALEIADALEQAGVRTWIDRTGISGGQRWADAIVGAVRSAASVIVLCSDRSLRSRNVQRELQIAWDEDVPILPALLEPVDFPESVVFFLQGVQWIELFEFNSVEKLMVALGVERLERHAGQPDVEAEQIHARRIQLPPRRQLIGRDSQIAQLVELCGKERERLVTIVGPGGIGKTVLAVAVGEALIPAFRDGVVFVDLAPIRERGQVVTAIGQTLQIGASSAMAQADRLAALLDDKQILLILDNFEQVVDAAVEIATLLAATTRVQVLVTSRIPLRVREERTFAAPTLLADGKDAEGIDAAFTLFVARAREDEPRFEVTDRSRDAIVEICRRLDGLPLAIELAAARARLFPPELMLSRMDRALPILSGGARDAPERHRTLTATITWSYQQLSPSEQLLFRLMGAFSGGCRFEAIESMLIDLTGSSDDLFAGLEGLVDWSLVRQASGTSGEPRFLMLETIREFAAIQLIASGMEPVAREAHAAWCLALATSIEHDLRNAIDQQSLFRVVEDEIGNIRVALRYFQEIGDGSRLIRLVTAIDEYLLSHPFDRELLEWLEAGFALSVEVDDATLIIARCNAAGVAGRTKVFDRGQMHVDQALELAAKVGSPYLVGRAFFAQGAQYEHLLDAANSLIWYERAVEAFRATDARSYLAMSLVECGDKRHWLGDFAGAAAVADEGQALMRTTGDFWALGMVLAAQSQLAASMGELDKAVDLSVEGLSVTQHLGDARTTLGIVAGIGRIAIKLGEVCVGVGLLGWYEMQVAKGHATAGYPGFFVPGLREQARIELGDAAFDSCLAEGARLSFDAGIDRAQTLLEKLRAQLSPNQDDSEFV